MRKIRRAREGDLERAVEVDKPERVDSDADEKPKKADRASLRAQPGDLEKRPAQ